MTCFRKVKQQSSSTLSQAKKLNQELICIKESTDTSSSIPEIESLAKETPVTEAVPDLILSSKSFQTAESLVDAPEWAEEESRIESNSMPEKVSHPLEASPQVQVPILALDHSCRLDV